MQQVIYGRVVDAIVGSDPRTPQRFATPAGETGLIDLFLASVLTGGAYNLTSCVLILVVTDKNGTVVISRLAVIPTPYTSGRAFFILSGADTAALLGGYQMSVLLTAADGGTHVVVPSSSTFWVFQTIGDFDQAVTVPSTQLPLAQGPPGLGLTPRLVAQAYPANFLELVIGDPTAGSFNVALPLIASLVGGSGGTVVVVNDSSSANYVGAAPSGSDVIRIGGTTQSLELVNAGEVLRLTAVVDPVRGNRWFAW